MNDSIGSTTGLIAFFDILGYQNLLNNNPEINTSILEILDIIENLPEEAKKILVDSSKKAESTSNSQVTNNIVFPEIRKTISAIKHLVFSDTILLTLQYDDTDDELAIRMKHMVMLAISATVAAQMFAKGLPVCGVLHKGEFFVKNNCFVGKAIVDAYQLCNELNYSGVVCSHKFSEHLEKLSTESKVPEYKLAFRYLTPMKNEREEKLYNINWLINTKNLDDIESIVLKAFWSHNKDCSIAVDKRIQNTAKLIRKMLFINSQLVNK
ncbi:hypothetical protein [Nitrosomonas sp.]|uniref:hypothetical protein n=1 Tax=Nitrosomonas sp. TaxID=42353 RepID=UPI0025D052D4|nr:hypothetical protein [Nitrosomonas sp.]